MYSMYRIVLITLIKILVLNFGEKRNLRFDFVHSWISRLFFGGEGSGFTILHSLKKANQEYFLKHAYFNLLVMIQIARRQKGHQYFTGTKQTAGDELSQALR